MSNKELVDTAREMVRNAVQINPGRLEEAAKYLHEYLFATKQPVDYSDTEVMEVFDLFQVTHQLLAICKQRSGSERQSDQAHDSGR